ncbi:MAG: response regulator [Syntrophobacteraceae bacterium]
MTLPGGQSVLILVADDDEEDCMFAQEALMEWSSRADVRFAGNGQVLMDYLHSCEAVCTSLEKPCPDLVLLDLNMPKKNGREALREIKAHPRLQSIPVVILSTSSDQEDINFCHRYGANSFISKSADLQVIIDKIKALCDHLFNAASLPDIDPLSNASPPA